MRFGFCSGNMAGIKSFSRSFMDGFLLFLEVSNELKNRLEWSRNLAFLEATTAVSMLMLGVFFIVGAWAGF